MNAIEHAEHLRVDHPQLAARIREADTLAMAIRLVLDDTIDRVVNAIEAPTLDAPARAVESLRTGHTVAMRLVADLDAQTTEAWAWHTGHLAHEVVEALTGRTDLPGLATEIASVIGPVLHNHELEGS